VNEKSPVEQIAELAPQAKIEMLQDEVNKLRKLSMYINESAIVLNITILKLPVNTSLLVAMVIRIKICYQSM